jgi:Lrp/AsnC family transcriptional regulator for asnA, asnC and gidA
VQSESHVAEQCTNNQHIEEKNSMDELDRKIISLLESNGRASNARIARDVGVSEGTVRRRLKRLMQERIINVVALPDPRKLGYESEALIGVQVDPDKVDIVATKLASLQHTRWVAVTTGTYDIFAWATLPSAEALGTFLREQVGAIAGVRRTETFVNLAVMKREYGIPV